MATKRKIELPADLTTGYVAPEDASVAELTEMIKAATEAADALLADDAKGPLGERVEKANWYIGAIEAIKGRQDAIVADDAAQKQQLDETRARLKAQVNPDPEPDTEGDDGADSGEGSDEEPEGGVPVNQAGTATDPAAAAPAGEPVLVASAGRRSSVAAAARGAGQPKAATLVQRRKGPEAHLVAGAGVAGMQAGATIDWDAFGRAAESQFNALPKRAGSARSVQRIGDLAIPTADERLVASANAGPDTADLDEAIDWALSSERLKAETGEDHLTAAGWCAPSETLYDLLDFTSEDGILNLPGITVNRGGVRYALGPDFTAMWGTSGAASGIGSQTEAQNIAGTVKPVVNIPCPTFADHRMGVDFIYLTGDILTSKGYPEAYTDFTRKALKAFAHYQNMKTIADMVTASTAVTLPGPTAGGSASQNLLGAVELQITDMRYKNRMAENAPVEVVLPLWIKGVIRSDLAKRTAVEDASAVTDAQIVAYFAERGAAVQFVYDWQDAFSGVAAGFGAATAIVGWPTTVNFLVYPAGTFMQANNDVIELNAVYDSTLLKTNQYVALFLERARLTLLRGFDARVVTVPVPALGVTTASVAYNAGTYPTNAIL
jgi:hypothetical protein